MGARPGAGDCHVIEVNGRDDLERALKTFARRMQPMLAELKRKSRRVSPSENRRMKSLMARRRLKKRERRQREAESEK
jgi:ribosomal protein S21